MLQLRAVRKILTHSLIVVLIGMTIWPSRSLAAFRCNAIFELAETRASFDIKLDELRAKRENELKDSILNCPRYDLQNCISKRINEKLDPEEKSNADFLKSAFKKSCLLGGNGNLDLAKKSRSSYVFAATIATTSLLGSHFSRASINEKSEFPIAYFATSQLFLLIGAEVACRNMANSGNTNFTRKQILWQNYKAYTIMNVFSNLLYIVAMAGEDHFRGHGRPFTEYVTEAGVSFVWDSVMSAFHVKYMDRFLIESVPQFRNFVNAAVKAKIFSLKWVRSDSGWVLKLIKLPGFGTEAGVRWMYSYLRAFAWQTASDEIREQLEKEKQK